MTDLQTLWQSLDATVQDGWAPGLVAAVRHQGETQYYATGQLRLEPSPAMTEQTRFRISSLSKPFAGALAALLIADGIVALDDPVDRWLPELANPQVLVDPAGTLDKTVPAQRSITVRDLLTFTNGFGLSFQQTPLRDAATAAGIGIAAIAPNISADDYMRLIGELPLAHQPGEHWCYGTGANLLSILLARATGRSLSQLLTERILDPLQMRDTSFWSNGVELPTQYRVVDDVLNPIDPTNQALAKPPLFETLAGGLVSTAPDLLAFLAALADDTLIDPDLRRQMTSDQLTDAQRPGLIELSGGPAGWGWCIGVETAQTNPWSEIGSFGWFGGTGCSAAVHPGRELIGVVLTQRLLSGPQVNFRYFWEPLVQAIDRA